MSSLGCKEPGTLGTFHHGSAESLRLSADVIVGVQRSLRLSAHFRIHHGGAESLRLSADVIIGVSIA